MPGADDWARASEDAHLEWPSAGDGDGAHETAPAARSFFLGQLPEDEPADIWADGGEGDGADPDRELQDGEQDLDPFATSFETELHDPIATDVDETELSVASLTDEPTRVITGAVSSVGARQALRAARQRRGRARLSRVALVAGVVAALVGGTAVYVGTHANADDHHASRSTSTSIKRESSSTTPTTVAASAGAPGTAPAPDPAVVPGSAAPTAPEGTSSAPSAAPGSPAPTSPRAPGSTAAPPNTAAPPSSPPPRSPMCQVLPVLCP
ncbi:MAG TPA: hypothetical protein VG348_11480 [Acidimicrobiia bacterium]|nr:hypothetical protein [Acidimicrobiia bacterium]